MSVIQYDGVVIDTPIDMNDIAYVVPGANFTFDNGNYKPALFGNQIADVFCIKCHNETFTVFVKKNNTESILQCQECMNIFILSDRSKNLLKDYEVKYKILSEIMEKESLSDS